MIRYVPIAIALMAPTVCIAGDRPVRAVEPIAQAECEKFAAIIQSITDVPTRVDGLKNFKIVYPGDKIVGTGCNIIGRKNGKASAFAYTDKFISALPEWKLVEGADGDNSTSLSFSSGSYVLFFSLDVDSGSICQKASNKDKCYKETSEKNRFVYTIEAYGYRYVDGGSYQQD